MRLFGARTARGAVRERNRVDRRRARTVLAPTVRRLGRVQTAQVRCRHRGCGDVGGGSAAEVEIVERVVGRRACGCDRDDVGSEAEVVEDVCGDPWIGDEGEHAQVIAAPRALGDVVAEHPAPRSSQVERMRT